MNEFLRDAEQGQFAWKGDICPVCRRHCGHIGRCEACGRAMGLTHMYYRMERSTDGDPTPIMHFTCQDCAGKPRDAFYHAHVKHDDAPQEKEIPPSETMPQPSMLEKAVEAVSKNPNIKNAELAQVLGVELVSVASLWKLKAREVIQQRSAPLIHPTQRKGNRVNLFNNIVQHVQKIAGVADEDVTTPPRADFIEDDVTDITIPTPNGRKLTSTMSPDELRRRRMNRVENAKLGRPLHEGVMLFFLKCWLLVGPVAFVLLTAAEVAYILANLVAPNDRNGQTIIWAGALFIELAMMFTTFGVAIKRRDLAEKKDTYGSVPFAEQAQVWGGTILWLIFATINIIGQSSFLMNVIASSHGKVPMTLLYIFVASRVTGFILGDASTAFFLAQVGDSDLKLVARSEREKGKLYADLARAEGERKLVEAKADADVLLVQIEVQQKQEDARFLADLKRQTFESILGRPRITELPAPTADTALPSPETTTRPTIHRTDMRRSE